MSADMWLEVDGEEVFHINVTYNLTPMLIRAEWIWPDQPTEDDDPVFGRVMGPCWSRQHLDGARAADIGEKAMYVLRNLESDPDEYRKLNPSNGWGNYDDLISDWRCFVAAIRAYPNSMIRTWF